MHKKMRQISCRNGHVKKKLLVPPRGTFRIRVVVYGCNTTKRQSIFLLCFGYTIQKKTQNATSHILPRVYRLSVNSTQTYTGNIYIYLSIYRYMSSEAMLSDSSILTCHSIHNIHEKKRHSSIVLSLDIYR